MRTLLHRNLRANLRIIFRGNAMLGANCALFCCSTSRKSSLLLNDGDET